MEQASTRQVPHQHHHSPPPMMQDHHHHQQRPSVGAEKASDTMVLQTNSPMPTNQDPVKWSREEVLNWLKWCQEEFSLDSVNAEKFTMNGKALCLMPKQSFCDRAPECGDILYELLQKLFRKECRFYHPNSSEPRRSPDPQFNRISGSSESQNVSGSSQETLGYQGSLTIPPSNSSPRLPIDLSAQPEKPNTQYGPLCLALIAACIFILIFNLSFDTGGDCRLLWDFLVQLLKNKTYMPYIRWEDRRERVFRILDPVQIANLWGLQKNRTNMTYEKLSRALRYYYKMGILQKEQGQKLTYRFLQDPKDIANSQRFSKMARNKDNPEHSEVTGSQASPIHPFSTASSTSPLVMSSSPSTATSMSMHSSAMMSSTMMPSLMTPSSLGSNRMYGLTTQVPHSTDRLYPDHEDSCPSSSIGQRSSVHMASTSSTPSPSPPVAGDDPVAVATHQMEGVSMMALKAQWQAANSGTSETKIEGLKVKEEPSSRPQSPEMEC
nr:DNA-binding protein Ets97D-like [Lytechinus pictus]